VGELTGKANHHRAAEHALALMFALSAISPRPTLSTMAGGWERKKPMWQ